jgi:hypothetical protein
MTGIVFIKTNKLYLINTEFKQLSLIRTFANPHIRTLSKRAPPGSELCFQKQVSLCGLV